jgi:hypothetical protein
MLQYFRLVGLALLLSVGVGSVGKAGINQFAIDLELNSFRFSALSSLPKGPSPDISGSPCTYFVVPKLDQKFKSSQFIQDKGWAILSEVRLAQYHFIAFAGSFDPSTSGACIISQSNIAIFEKEQLLGVVYLDDLENSLIGNLRLMDAGFIRVFSGDMIQEPVADIQLSLNGFEMKTMSDLTAYCNGGSILPSIIGTNIIEARNALFDYGFEPIEATEPLVISWRQYLFDYGIREVDSCSGTGFAFCSFSYENESGFVDLITAGEDDFPTVVRSRVKCKS